MKGLETTMTPEQICDLLDISVSTLKGQFKRMAAKAEKKGYKLTKEGRGANTKYYLESLAPRAKTLFEEESKDMNLDKEKSLYFLKDLTLDNASSGEYPSYCGACSISLIGNSSQYSNLKWYVATPLGVFIPTIKQPLNIGSFSSSKCFFDFHDSSG